MTGVNELVVRSMFRVVAKLTTLLLTTFIGLFVTSSVCAQNYLWDSNNNTNWTRNGNWGGDGRPGGNRGLASWLIPRLGQSQTSNELVAVLTLAQKSNPPAILLEIMGTAATAAGNHEVALALLSRAVELDPDYAVAWNNLAVVAKRDRAIEFAFNSASQAVRLEPCNDAMRLTRGMIALEMENWETAQMDLEQVLQNQPDNIEIHSYLATAYEQLGKPDKASFHQLLAGK